jgi:hypothetical protein
MFSEKPAKGLTAPIDQKSCFEAKSRFTLSLNSGEIRKSYAVMASILAALSSV